MGYQCEAHPFRYRGYDPTRNQSEFGAPQTSRYGSSFEHTRLIGHPTYLPGPYHYRNMAGDVLQPFYTVVPVVWDNMGFGGQVPLSQSPRYQRPAPWNRPSAQG